MAEEPAQRRTDPGELAEYHVAAQRRREEQEAAKAQALRGGFGARAGGGGLAPEGVTGRGWSGRGRCRTGVGGGFLGRDLSVGVGTDGAYSQLVVPATRWGRGRPGELTPIPPPLQVGKGA